MTLDDMIKQYIHSTIETYLQERNNDQPYVTEYLTEELLDKYLNEHDYVTRDDVNDQISGATVYIEASLSA